jgi:hypothetical protein
LKTYDWQFPIAQAEIRRRLLFVQTNPEAVSGFERVHVPAKTQQVENIAAPQRFLAQTSAYLWSSLQMDTYREAATEFMRQYEAANQPPATSMPRLLIVMIGRGATNPPELFQKLRPHGQVRTNVNFNGNANAILEVVQRRCANHPEPYAHWYVDGGDPLPGAPAALTFLTWPALAPLKRRVLELIQTCIANGNGPEVLAERMAELQLDNSSGGLNNSDLRLEHFALSLFTENSGTQIFATTFVQAAIREIMRKAQPLTLLARFAPRQRQRTFNSMVANVTAHGTADLDPDGSLIDADMAAYYAYLELAQLPGAAEASLLVWFEDRPLAFTAGPRIPKNTTTGTACTLTDMLSDLVA